MSFTIDGSLQISIASQCFDVLRSVSVQVVNMKMVNLNFQQLQSALNGTPMRCSAFVEQDWAAIWHV